VTGGRWTVEPTAPLSGFSFDTRKLHAGEIFVALKTEKRDGHEFLADAQTAGAAAALVATPNKALALPQLVVANPLAAFHAIARAHRTAFRGPVVGISGSAGKTSTKDLLALLLGGESCGVLATEGNLNNHIGVPLTLTRLDPEKHAFAVIEAGVSTPGEMKPLAQMIAPDVAIITLVAPAHTEELGGIEGVAREKAVLAAETRKGGLAIFPKQTADFAAFRELETDTLVVERADVIRPTLMPKGRAYYALSHRAERTGISLVHGAPPATVYRMRRVSDGMAQNAALAICAAERLGVSRDRIQERLALWQAGKLRAEVKEVDGRLLYLDCYNANPASMSDALQAFDAIAEAGESRLYILGCMEELGVESAAHHRVLGRSLRLQPNDHVFVIGTHAHDVCAGVLEQGDFSRQLQIVSSLDPIRAFLNDWRGAVFVKGSRRYQLEKILEVQTSLPLSC
jgi:UDP-N-acetylmuramoyl-tripeptide--D-alanyl-D-alanine ligase